MSISVPPSVNYPSPLNAFPCRYENTPNEGFKQIPVEIDWVSMGGPSKSVYVNLQDNSQLVFSQIQALSIDNSQCGSDVTFIFPDNSETISIPAYSPKAVVPVFSNQTQFYVQCLNEEAEDITRFLILNFLPPPIAVPVSEEQNFSAIGGLPIMNTGSQQIVPATVSGTLENTYFNFTFLTNNAANGFTAQLEDGNGNVIALCTADGVNDQLVALTGWNLNNIKVRFQNGLKMVWTSSGLGSGTGVIGVYYRSP